MSQRSPNAHFGWCPPAGPPFAGLDHPAQDRPSLDGPVQPWKHPWKQSWKLPGDTPRNTPGNTLERPRRHSWGGGGQGEKERGWGGRRGTRSVRKLQPVLTHLLSACPPCWSVMVPGKPNQSSRCRRVPRMWKCMCALVHRCGPKPHDKLQESSRQHSTSTCISKRSSKKKHVSNCVVQCSHDTLQVPLTAGLPTRPVCCAN